MVYLLWATAGGPRRFQAIVRSWRHIRAAKPPTNPGGIAGGPLGSGGVDGCGIGRPDSESSVHPKLGFTPVHVCRPTRRTAGPVVRDDSRRVADHKTLSPRTADGPRLLPRVRIRSDRHDRAPLPGVRYGFAARGTAHEAHRRKRVIPVGPEIEVDASCFVARANWSEVSPGGPPACTGTTRTPRKYGSEVPNPYEGVQPEAAPTTSRSTGGYTVALFSTLGHSSFFRHSSFVLHLSTFCTSRHRSTGVRRATHPQAIETPAYPRRAPSIHAPTARICRIRVRVAEPPVRRYHTGP